MEITTTLVLSNKERQALAVMAEFARHGMEDVYRKENATPESEEISFYGNGEEDSHMAYQLACRLASEL